MDKRGSEYTRTLTASGGLRSLSMLRQILDPVAARNLSERLLDSYYFHIQRVFESLTHSVELERAIETSWQGGTGGTADPADTNEGSHADQGSTAMDGGGSGTRAGDWTRDIPHPADYGPPPTSDEVRMAKQAIELAQGQSLALRQTQEQRQAVKIAAEERKRLWLAQNRRGQYQKRNKYRGRRR